MVKKIVFMVKNIHQKEKQNKNEIHLLVDTYPKKSSKVDICSVFQPTAPITEDIGSTIKGIASIKSSFSLKQVSYKTALPLPS